MRASTAISVGLLGVMLTSGCTAGEATADLAGYRPPSPGSKQLTLLYIEGPSDQAGDPEILHQDSIEVQVRVKFKRSGKTSNLNAVVRDITITLEEPLGNRKVVDSTGKQLTTKSPQDHPKINE